MIFDIIDNWKLYFYDERFTKAFEFIQTLSEDTEEGIVEIDGKNVYANIMSYQTKAEPEAVLEAHRKYIDIQLLLNGKETIKFTPLNDVISKEAYDSEKDVEFFIPPENASGQVTLSPGVFSVFFPEDTHMPQLFTSSGPQKIKKVVVKIAV